MSLRRRPLCVAVTGLNATDNPAPGVAVIRALRVAHPEYRYVGLAYDALDPGIYAEDIINEIFLLPYPSQGMEPLLSRLVINHYMHDYLTKRTFFRRTPKTDNNVTH